MTEHTGIALPTMALPPVPAHFFGLGSLPHMLFTLVFLYILGAAALFSTFWAIVIFLRACADLHVPLQALVGKDLLTFVTSLVCHSKVNTLLHVINKLLLASTECVTIGASFLLMLGFDVILKIATGLEYFITCVALVCMFFSMCFFTFYYNIDTCG